MRWGRGDQGPEMVTATVGFGYDDLAPLFGSQVEEEETPWRAITSQNKSSDC